MVSIVDFMFLNLTFSIIVGGFFVNFLEHILPSVLIQMFRYGEFSHKGAKSQLLSNFEVPKSYFKHFYSFASLYTIASLVLLLTTFCFDNGQNVKVFRILELLCGRTHKPVCRLASIIAMTLLCFQCLRRFYETHYLQVFADKSRINWSHCIVGYSHYFGCITTILAHSLHTSDSLGPNIWLDRYTAIIFIPALMIFFIAWLKQYESNLILADLRRDKKSGSVITENFGIPYGGWYQYVSSPHRLTEIMLYLSLWLLIPVMSYFYIFIWVLVNQVETALLAHWWYQETFKYYPRQRKAIFPNVL